MQRAKRVVNTNIKWTPLLLQNTNSHVPYDGDILELITNHAHNTHTTIKL